MEMGNGREEGREELIRQYTFIEHILCSRYWFMNSENSDAQDTAVLRENISKRSEATPAGLPQPPSDSVTQRS